MPVEEMMDYLSRSTKGEQVQFQVAFQCAPLFKGVKPGAVMTLPEGGGLWIGDILKNTRIRSFSVCQGKKGDTVFLYRKEELEQILSGEKVKGFMASMGYTDMGVEAVLSRFRRRYAGYREKKGSFPHELGVLLGYPMEDIQGFIRWQGKNSLLNGYWKVYQNPAYAKLIFKLYDWARECAVREYMNGHSLCQIIC